MRVVIALNTSYFIVVGGVCVCTHMHSTVCFCFICLFVLIGSPNSGSEILRQQEG